jgi:hypothetical protein
MKPGRVAAPLPNLDVIVAQGAATGNIELRPQAGEKR